MFYSLVFSANMVYIYCFNLIMMMILIFFYFTLHYFILINSFKLMPVRFYSSFNFILLELIPFHSVILSKPFRILKMIQKIMRMTMNIIMESFILLYFLIKISSILFNFVKFHNHFYSNFMEFNHVFFKLIK